MKFIIFYILLISVFPQSFAAEIGKLKKLYSQMYSTNFYPRNCGVGIREFLKEAQRKQIKLDDSYSMKILGSGFLETKGFFVRGTSDEVKMLGYHHYVFVADGYVFDFHLREPLVLKFKDYVNLQLRPPYEPFRYLNVLFDMREDLRYYKLELFEPLEFIKYDAPKAFSKVFFPEYFDPKQLEDIKPCNKAFNG